MPTATRPKKPAPPAPLTLDHASLNQACQIAKLIADETRVRLIGLLATGEKNVTELCEAIGQSQSAVSHHLALLRVSGIMENRREGKFNFYSLTDNGRAVLEMIRTMAEF
jgi:ArsR family transcriptional regulator